MSTFVFPEFPCNPSEQEIKDYVNCLLHTTYEMAYDMANRSIVQSDIAVGDARAALTKINRNETLYKMTAEEPEIPEIDSTRIAYHAERENLIPLINDLWKKFLLENGAIFNPARDAAGNWLVSVINNGYQGIPDFVDKQIFSAARSRVYAAASTAKRNLVDTVSARGWQVPPGALIGALNDAELSAVSALASVSIEIAGKRYDMQVETARFAVSEALKVYTNLLSAGASFIGAMISAFDQALRQSENDPNVKANIWNAAANRFRSRIEFDQTAIRADDQLQQRVLEEGRIAVDGGLRRTGNIIEAEKFASEMIKGISQAFASQGSVIFTSATSS